MRDRRATDGGHAELGVYEFYFIFNAPLAKDGKLVLFDTMAILDEFTTADMQELAELEITVQAFAVQTYGFDNAYDAMTRAFPTYFGALS